MSFNKTMKAFTKLLAKDTSLETVTLLRNEGTSVVVKIVIQLTHGTNTRNVRYDYDGEVFNYKGEVF